MCTVLHSSCAPSELSHNIITTVTKQHTNLEERYQTAFFYHTSLILRMSCQILQIPDGKILFVDCDKSCVTSWIQGHHSYCKNPEAAQKDPGCILNCLFWNAWKMHPALANSGAQELFGEMGLRSYAEHWFEQSSSKTGTPWFSINPKVWRSWHPNTNSFNHWFGENLSKLQMKVITADARRMVSPMQDQVSNWNKKHQTCEHKKV